MEFKDKLKQLRKEQGLTQAQLAAQIFVSRSTVAKWENGLGLPNPEAMGALETMFGISNAQLVTEDPEIVIVKKNQRLHMIGQISLWAIVLAGTILISILAFAVHRGCYGLVPDMAAGVYRDDDFIDTGDYRIYFFQFEGAWENGKHWSSLQGWRPVQKHFWGYTVSEEDYSYRIITKNNYVVGRLYSIKGKYGYYNLIRKAGIYKPSEDLGEGLVWEIPGELITATSVTVDGTIYELQHGFFFITPKPVEIFKIEGQWYDVE